MADLWHHHLLQTLSRLIRHFYLNRLSAAHNKSIHRHSQLRNIAAAVDTRCSAARRSRGVGQYQRHRRRRITDLPTRHRARHVESRLLPPNPNVERFTVTIPIHCLNQRTSCFKLRLRNACKVRKVQCTGIADRQVQRTNRRPYRHTISQRFPPVPRRFHPAARL